MIRYQGNVLSYSGLYSHLEVTSLSSRIRYIVHYPGPGDERYLTQVCCHSGDKFKIRSLRDSGHY